MNELLLELVILEQWDRLELVAQLTIRGIFPLHPLLQHLEGMVQMGVLLFHLLHLTAGQGEGRGQGWPLGTNLTSKQLQKLLVWLQVSLLWT